MDPIMQWLQSMMGQMPASGAGGSMQPGFDTTPMPGAAPAAGGGGDIMKILGALKAPEAQKPVFSGGVSGAGLPYVPQQPNTLTGALEAGGKRIAGASSGMPSLGAILAGGMR